MKNTLPNKAFIQIWKRDQKFYGQAKAKRVQHHKTSFTRKVKDHNQKYENYKRKNLIGKGKYTVKVVNQ